MQGQTVRFLSALGARNRSILGIALGSVAVWATVAVAQQAETTGPDVYLDLSTGLEATDNYEYLETPSGDSYLWATDAVVGYSSETRSQIFDARLGGRLELGSFAEDTDENGGVKNPFLSLDYVREASGSKFEAAFLARERDNGIDVIDAANSTDLIVDQGTRRDLRFSAGLELGQGAPVSFAGDVSFDGRRFYDSEDPDLTDQDVWNASAEVGFALTRTAQLLVTASYYDRDSIDNLKSDEVNTRLGVGLRAQIDPSLTFRGTIGHSINHRTDTVNGKRETTTEERPTINLELIKDRRRGTNTFSFGSELDNSGLRTTVSAGRATDLANGSIDFSLGATHSEDGQVNPVGSLNWRRENSASVFSLAFNNGVYTNDDDEEVLFGRFSMDVVKQVNAVSGFRVNLAASTSRNIDDDSIDARQASAGLSYFHDIDSDWSFVTGYTHEFSVDENDQTVTANKVYATIDRRFSLRP